MDFIQSIGTLPPPVYMGTSANQNQPSLKSDRQLRALYRLLRNAPFDKARITRREQQAFLNVIKGRADLVWLFTLLDSDN